ncbi:MAG: ribonuclease J [Firmicutes bacterium]|nr:ribonuclease J [Candidatus Colimorpha enterica]
MARKKQIGNLKVIMLGGMNEIGKNLAVIEYEDDIIMVDCGMGFPDEDMLGVDLVIPDTKYLEDNCDRIRGLFITHGHEDHIGAIPYILRKFDVPIYGTNLALGILENKLAEHTVTFAPKLNVVRVGDVIKVGQFEVEFIRVNHSIADACCLAIKTPAGTILHTGDFKLDLTPIEGEMLDITRLGQLGQEGIKLLMCESTNAERPGYTPSEKKVGQALNNIFMMNSDKRIVIATFSSNVHRVQQIINISIAHGRKVAITGRSMLNVVSAALRLGYMTLPEDLLIDLSDIDRYSPEKVTIITTGTQGEPMSALYRMAFGSHDKVKLTPSDLVVISASAIPGNEKMVTKIINELVKNGIGVFKDDSVAVHVSGHACQEEIKLMMALTRPLYFIPIHGEYKHLAANRALALDMGIPAENIFIPNLGDVVEITPDGASISGTVPAGKLLIDGYGIGDIGAVVLRDRKHLAQDGIIAIVTSIDFTYRTVLSGPDVVSRGFVYVKESEELVESIRQIAEDTVNDCLDHNIMDHTEIKAEIKTALSKFIFINTGRKPMILPIIMSV